MLKLSQDTITKLSSFNQRKLMKGEIFLLAKAIADELPLMPADEDSVKLFALNHKRFINEVISALNQYTYLGDEEQYTVEKLICSLTLWRATIAHRPIAVLFRDSPDTVIDDLSGLLRFVDVTYLCSVGDIINNANYIANLFRTLVQEVKLTT